MENQTTTTLANSKICILDRDGVLNYDSENFIKNVDEWQPLPGSLEAVGLLKQAGYLVAIATNQSGIARNLFDLSMLFQIHGKMEREVRKFGGYFDYIAYCPHGPNSDCHCRKPRPGMYKRIANVLSVSLEDAFVVGDSLRDLVAADEVGAKPILVLTGKGSSTFNDNRLPNATDVFPSLYDFVFHVLSDSIVK